MSIEQIIIQCGPVLGFLLIVVPGFFYWVWRAMDIYTQDYEISRALERMNREFFTNEEWTNQLRERLAQIAQDKAKRTPTDETYIDAEYIYHQGQPLKIVEPDD